MRPAAASDLSQRAGTHNCRAAADVGRSVDSFMESSMQTTVAEFRGV
jgi:hypothetical protein